MKTRNGWYFLLPGILLLVITLGVPVYYAIQYSLSEVKLFRFNQQYFVGLENYQLMWEDPLFLRSVSVTFQFTIGVTVLTVLLGLVIASVMSSKFIRGTKLARILMAFYLVPFVTTPVVVGVLGRLFIWEPEYGLINYILAMFGLNGPGWLISQDTALLATIITNAWRLIPLALLVFYAALATVPDELIESAEVDGANIFTIYSKIKFPLIRYHTIFISLIVITSAYREFDAVYSLTGGGPGRATNVLSLLVYNQGISRADMGMGNAIAFSMFLMIAVVTYVYTRIFRLNKEEN